MDLSNHFSDLSLSQRSKEIESFELRKLSALKYLEKRDKVIAEHGDTITLPASLRFFNRKCDISLLLEVCPCENLLIELENYNSVKYRVTLVDSYQKLETLESTSKIIEYGGICNTNSETNNTTQRFSFNKRVVYKDSHSYRIHQDPISGSNCVLHYYVCPTRRKVEVDIDDMETIQQSDKLMFYEREDLSSYEFSLFLYGLDANLLKHINFGVDTLYLEFSVDEVEEQLKEPFLDLLREAKKIKVGYFEKADKFFDILEVNLFPRLKLLELSDMSEVHESKFIKLCSNRSIDLLIFRGSKGYLLEFGSEVTLTIIDNSEEIDLTEVEKTLHKLTKLVRPNKVLLSVRIATFENNEVLETRTNRELFINDRSAITKTLKEIIEKELPLDGIVATHLSSRFSLNIEFDRSSRVKSAAK